MSQFQLFDGVELTEEIRLTGDFSNALNTPDIAAIGTVGAIVEVFNGGEAYLVELFGGWIAMHDCGNVSSMKPTDPEAFRETIGVETGYPHQLRPLSKTTFTNVI